MLFGKIILFTAIVKLFMCDACETSSGSEKRKLLSQTFQKLLSDRTKSCRHINRDFAKLEGNWYYVLRTISLKPTSLVQCGRLTVNKASEDGFESTFKYINDGKMEETPINGHFFDKTTVEIPGMKHLITGNPKWNFRFTVEMGMCDNNFIFFILPKHYHGGGMIFSRELPVVTNELKHRFETYGEMNGIERTVRVSQNCNLRYHRDKL